MTFSVTTSSTFSIIHARYLSSKVAADMHLCAQYYGKPTEARIREHNCAVREIAQRFTEVCHAEAAFIEDILGALVERQSHMMHGCSACEYTAIKRAV